MLDCFPSRASCGFLLGVNWRQPESDWQMENVDRCGAPRHVLIIKSVTGAHANTHRRAHTHTISLLIFDHAICLGKCSARLNTVIRFINNKSCDYYSQCYLIWWCLMISRLQFHYWGLWPNNATPFFFFFLCSCHLTCLKTHDLTLLLREMLYFLTLTRCTLVVVGMFFSLDIFEAWYKCECCEPLKIFVPLSLCP